MEQLVLYFVDALLGIDRLLQKLLTAKAPNIEELWESPARVLERGEIRFGPFRRYAVSIVLGGFAGFLLSCPLYFALIEDRRPDAGPPPLPVAIFRFAGMLTGCLAGAALGAAAVCYLTRGGEMVLRPLGVVLRYRGDRVFCPWAVFGGVGEPWKPDRS